ncbi:MAG: carbonic anhydrase [Methyloceanibacter sp.]
MEGYRRFLRDRHAPEKGRYLQLAELGQTPTAMVIACCDARLDVSAIFDAEPGALFILRNVANLVPPYEPEGRYHGTSAAIEYAALALKVPHIVVLGHSRCGGVMAYREGISGNKEKSGFIGRWLALLDDAKVAENDVAAHGEETAFEFAAIRASLAHLRGFPVIREREQVGMISLHGLHFDIGSGQLLGLDKETGHFIALAED